VKEPFTFGVPLIPRVVSADWSLVEHLLGLTLRSVLAQADQDFRFVLATHDVPSSWRIVAGDIRFELAMADWSPEPPTIANDDGGRKKWLIKQRVLAAGGGLLMFLDADDWVARDFIETARIGTPSDAIGAIIRQGYALDYSSLRVASFPMAKVFEGPISALCGSTTIGRVVPGSTEAHRVDPHLVLGSHHEWEDHAALAGLRISRLDTKVVYVIGTGTNHSEAQGPFANWRSQLTRMVRLAGEPIGSELASNFGQSQREIWMRGSNE